MQATHEFVAMGDPLFNDGHAYQHPPIRWNNGQLTDFYSACGVFERHNRCLRCCEIAGLEHRLNWLNCRLPCKCCRGIRNSVKHVGKVCPQQVNTYADFFTADFFARRAGIRLRPGDKNFIHEFNKTQDRLPVPNHKAREERRPRPDESFPQKPDRRLDKNADDVSRGIKTVERISSHSIEKPDKRKHENTSPGYDHIALSTKEAMPKRRLVECIKCGEAHAGSSCPKLVCSMCHRPGHAISDCPARAKCLRCGNKDHKIAQCPDKGGCFICHKDGHQKETCPERAKQRMNEPLPRRESDDKAPEKSRASLSASVERPKEHDIPVLLQTIEELKVLLRKERETCAQWASAVKSFEELYEREKSIKEGLAKELERCKRR